MKIVLNVLVFAVLLGLSTSAGANTNIDSNLVDESIEAENKDLQANGLATDIETTAPIGLVQDVLEQDIHEILQNSRQSKNEQRANNSYTFLAPKLVALYGVGKALMAEVQVGNQAYLYVRGDAYPVGFKGDNKVYQLKAMNGACVQLEKGMDKHSLCLRMLLGENQS